MPKECRASETVKLLAKATPNKEEGKEGSPKVGESLKKTPEAREDKIEEKGEANSVTKSQVERKNEEKEVVQSSPKVQETKETVSQGQEGNSWSEVSPARAGRQGLKQSGESAIVSTASRFAILVEGKEVNENVETLGKENMEDKEEGNGSTKEDSDREEGEIIIEKNGKEEEEENVQPEKKEEKAERSSLRTTKQIESPSSTLNVNKKAPPRAAGKKKVYKKK